MTKPGIRDNAQVISTGTSTGDIVRTLNGCNCGVGDYHPIAHAGDCPAKTPPPPEPAPSARLIAAGWKPYHANWLTPNDSTVMTEAQAIARLEREGVTNEESSDNCVVDIPVGDGRHIYANRTGAGEVSTAAPWVRVEDRMPPEGDYVLICFLENEVSIGVWSEGDWYFARDVQRVNERFGPVEHWQPLPNPPEVMR